MDTRLYILAGLFVLVVVAFLVLLVILIRFNRNKSPYPVEPEGVWPMLKPAPPEVVEVDLLSKADDKFARPVTGATALLSQPIRTGSWKPPEEASSTAAQTDDYWDSLIDEPSLLVRPTRPSPEPVSSTAPAPISSDSVHEVTPPSPDSVAEGEGAGVQPVVPDASPGNGDELSTMIQELEEESVPVSLPRPVPIEVPPLPVPVIETPQEPASTQATAVKPEPAPAPAPQPVALALPPDVPEHVLVAPVEMWFGESRIGVKAGTRTYDLFQKYARVIREDYHRATSGTL